MSLKVMLFLCLSISFSANAAIKLVSCNGCSDVGMERAAELSQNRIGSSFVAVINFRNSSAQKFYTSLRFSNRGEPIRSAAPVNFSTDEQHDIDLYIEYREELANYIVNFAKPLYEPSPATDSDYSVVGVDGPLYSPDDSHYFYGGVVKVKGDPYTFLSSSWLQNDVYDWFEAGGKGTFLKLLDSSLGAVAIPTGADLDVYIELVFYSSAQAAAADERNGVVVATLSQPQKQFNILSAKDADNNTIPLVKEDVGGYYRFIKDANSEIFLNYINLMFDSALGSPTCIVTSRKVSGDNYTYTYSCG